jgi:signal transduction histidine kinase
MTTVLRKLQTAFSRGRELADILQETKDDSAARAVRLTGLLHTAWPTPLSAVFLSTGPFVVGCVVDQTGQRRPAWENALRDTLTSSAGQSSAGQVSTVSWPIEGAVAGQTLAVAPMTFRGRCFGTLSLAVSEQEPLDQSSPIAVLLAGWAEQLAMLLTLEEQERHHESVRAEMVRQAGLSTIGELTGLVAHEFNNALNSIVLHVAVMGLDAPEKVRTELAVIRQLAANAAAQVSKLQQFNRQQRPILVPMDLNRLVRAAAEETRKTSPPKGESALTIHLDLAAELPSILGTETEGKRILKLLLASSARAMAAGPGSITIKTRPADKAVVLRVEDTGPGVDSASLPQLFEPFVALRPGSNGSDLAICKALVRRLHGSIQAENRPEGGLVFVIEFSVAPRPP